MNRIKKIQALLNNLAVLIALTTSVAALFLVTPIRVDAACADNSSAAIVKAPSQLPRVGCADNTNALQTVVRIAFGVLTSLCILFVVIGGIKYSLSGGDANAIASAKKTILYAVIGLILGLSVFVISSYVLRLAN